MTGFLFSLMVVVARLEGFQVYLVSISLFYGLFHLACDRKIKQFISLVTVLKCSGGLRSDSRITPLLKLFQKWIKEVCFLTFFS